MEALKPEIANLPNQERKLILRLSDDEWNKILRLNYKAETRKALEQMRQSDECVMTSEVGQAVVVSINAKWNKEGIPYRLVSDPSNAWWNNPNKVLRLQRKEDWKIEMGKA